MNTVLIIDDEEKLRSLLARIIGLEGFETLEAKDAKSAFRILEQNDVDSIVCDVKLPDANGVELITEFKNRAPFAEVILLTAYGNIPDSVQAIKAGAFDYLVKGDDNNRIIPLLNRAIEKSALTKQLNRLQNQLFKAGTFEKIQGKSTAIKSAIALAMKVAPTDAVVLLTGETGTGKEVFAQAIHQASARSSQNFVAINCAAIGKDILESEMFGHRAGAFTGATKDQKGLFEEANHGTIFFDEIGEMPVDLQAKLLRVIETSEFLKVGNTKPTRVNVRIIAATNRDLKQEITKERFRSDLYYRLSVFQIHLPALRDRKEDIEMLAAFFVQHFSEKVNKKAPLMTPSFLKALILHEWKGNIRELKNVIERSVILTDGNEILESTLPIDFFSNNTTEGESSFDLASVEKRHIQKILQHTRGNKTQATKLLNIGLTTLYQKIKDYNL